MHAAYTHLTTSASAAASYGCWVLQGASYKGALSLDLCWDVQGLPGTLQVLQKRLGSLPIMVKSTACHLHGEQPTGCSQQPKAAVWLEWLGA